MALEFTDRWYDRIIDPGFTHHLARGDLTRVGPNSSPETIWNTGYAERWVDRPANPFKYADLAEGEPVLNEAEYRTEQVDSWVEWSDERKREHLAEQITEQIPVYTGTDVWRDPDTEVDVAQVGAAANDKLAALQESTDLDAFDPTLAIARIDADVGYSRFAAVIREVTEWAGAPGKNLGFVARLRTEEGQESKGSEARLYVVSGPDTGAVLPFTQDANDLKTWTVESRDGYKWDDPEQVVEIKLMWGTGSLPASPVLTLNGYQDRKATIVRYGDVPTRVRRTRPNPRR